MALDGIQLSQEIQTEMGHANNSDEKKAIGRGIVDHIKAAATVDHASGLVTGDCPSSGGPLQNGAATSGVISGMDGDSMAQAIDGYPAQYLKLTPELKAMCGEIVSHIQNDGVVEFATGDITGTCTNTSNSPGSLQDGAGTNGKVKNLSETTLADNIHAALGFSGGTNQEVVDMSRAIVNHIMNNAVVEYAAGNVTGTCPAGGGPLQSGTGSGGVIS